MVCLPQSLFLCSVPHFAFFSHWASLRTHFPWFENDIEFPSRLGHNGWWPRASPQRSVGVIPDDLCRVLRPPQPDSTGVAMAAVDMPAQVRPRGVVGERGQLGTPD